MLRYLRKVTRKNIIVDPVVANGRNNLVLSEKDDKGNVKYTCTLLNVPSNSILIRLDERLLETRNVFISSSDKECQDRYDFEHFLCKKADYILIDAEHKFIFIIELKESNSANEHIKAQLIGGLCVFKYIESLIYYFSDDFRGSPHKQLPFHDYSYRYISVKHIKNQTKRKSGHNIVDSENYKDFSSPETFLHIRGRSKIPYSKILK